MQPLISAIVPCFNHGIYINSTLKAILEQTYKNIEIIIVDDGSDEETRNILREIKNSKIKIIYQENSKTSKARNIGFAHSSGKYILTIDADDLLENTFLERAKEILDKYPKIGAVSSWINCFGHSNYHWLPTGGGIEDFTEDINCSSCALIRREIWEANNGFDENMTIGYEDWEFWVNTTKKGWFIYMIPDFLIHYRIKYGSRAFDAFNYRDEIVRYIWKKHKDIFS